MYSPMSSVVEAPSHPPIRRSTGDRQQEIVLTVLALAEERGVEAITTQAIAERPLEIACSGSALVFPHEHFGDDLLHRAGARGYVIIRDATCRLFGYHGLMTEAGAFSLDHMFGF